MSSQALAIAKSRAASNRVHNSYQHQGPIPLWQLRSASCRERTVPIDNVQISCQTAPTYSSTCTLELYSFNIHVHVKYQQVSLKLTIVATQDCQPLSTPNWLPVTLTSKHAVVRHQRDSFPTLSRYKPPGNHQLDCLRERPSSCNCEKWRTCAFGCQYTA